MFGEKLQSLRKRKGMSQEELAQHINVSRQAVSKWELNDTLPDIEKLIKISELFEVTIDTLVKDEKKLETNINCQCKVISNEEKLHKRYQVIGGVCLGFSIISYFVIWILAKVYPPQASYYRPDQDRYVVGLELFVWVHDLSGFLGLCFFIFVSGLLLIYHQKVKRLCEYIKSL